jgi:osmotically-inducible protein OsmY
MRRTIAIVLGTAAAALASPACKNNGDSSLRGPPAANTASNQATAPAPSASAAAADDANAPIPDAKLASAIEESLARDPLLHSQPIRVSVMKGELTLDGTVRTLAAKWRAAKFAETFKGISLVTNRIVVAASSRPDAEITKEVNDAIQSDPATRKTKVGVTENGGTVTLRGSADSSTQRDLLSEDASRVPGVQEVNLALALSHGSTRGNAELEADIRDRFADDARLDGTHVYVALHEGDVAVSGLVGSLAQRDAATGDAWVEGVAGVDVHAVRVDWRENEQQRSATARAVPTDPHLAGAVSRNLSGDVRVGAQVPIVRVEQGVVTLSGNVMDFRAKNAAARDARCVSGVWRVDDRMTVLPALRESDATIQKQVMGGVYNDATVHDMPNIQITTQRARVTLQGAVASQEEKKEIEGDAEEVPGVVAVEDDLQVKGYGPKTHPAKPEALRHRAVESIFWDPRVQAGRVAVDVSPDGDVTLSGVVDSWAEARAATNDAIVAGAAHVIDHIRAAAALASSPP